MTEHQNFPLEHLQNSFVTKLTECMPTTSLYCCKLFPIFTSLHALLIIKVVLTTAHIAKIRFSFSQVFSVSLKVILKVAPRFSKITGRWWVCWSRLVCLTPLCRSPLSRKVFVKQMRKKRSQKNSVKPPHNHKAFNVYNLSLALQVFVFSNTKKNNLTKLS